ncbi:MAG TPA: 3',5'-cyclic-AMP phosphodiesterase [Acidiferrobacteraceae bacterium]|nr:3',5'-cyclic-AMP phosphodiesterase [Acidiferrobacteraceae bacterium]
MDFKKSDTVDTPIRVLQITDFHLFEAPHQTLMGVDTQKSFETVLGWAREDEWPPDLVLATGDLAQDGGEKTYRRLQSNFASFMVPTYWIPGNHDNPTIMQDTLIGGQVSADKRVKLGAWQIILLDSTVFGNVHGELCESELKKLDDWLTELPDKYAMVCLHHHPIAMGSDWIEPIGLKNSEDLFVVLDRHPQVKALVWGHVHQKLAQQRNGVKLLSSPSTCFQFKPHSSDFTVDTALPGYRRLDLYADGRIETRVERLEDYDLSLDPNSPGY